MPRAAFAAAVAMLGLAFDAAAQPAAPPKVVLLVRQRFKPAEIRERERLEHETAVEYNRLDAPVYWIEAQSYTGPTEVLFLDPFDSPQALEKAGAVLETLFKAHPDLVKTQAGINATLTSQTSVVGVRRDVPGVDSINLAKARYVRMLVVRTPRGSPQPDIVGLGLHFLYEVESGMDRPAFVIFQSMTDFAEIPAVRTTSGTIVSDVVYSFEPEMSHVPRAFGEQDPSFWTTPFTQR